MFENTRPLATKSKPSSEEWKTGTRITKENLDKGTGPIEHITAAQVFGGSSKPGPTIREPLTVAAPIKSPVIWFGKHKGKTVAQLKKEDPGYYDWACREIKGFKEKAK